MVKELKLCLKHLKQLVKPWDVYNIYSHLRQLVTVWKSCPAEVLFLASKQARIVQI